MLFEGIVTIKPTLKISKKGLSYAKFFIVDSKQASLEVIVFRDVAERAERELAIGDKVTVDGKIEVQAADNTTITSIKAYGFQIRSSKSSTTTSDSKHILSGENIHQGGIPGHNPTDNNILGRTGEITKKEYRAYMHQHGYRKVRIDPGRFEWKLKKDLIKINNTWEDPLSYAMDQLTPKRVNELLREGSTLKEIINLSLMNDDITFIWGSDEETHQC